MAKSTNIYGVFVIRGLCKTGRDSSYMTTQYRFRMLYYFNSIFRIKYHPNIKSMPVKADARLQPCLFTSSSLVWAQGKEKVNPTGSFLSLIFCFSIKSPRHSATWSNSCKRHTEVKPNHFLLEKQISIVPPICEILHSKDR